MAFSVIPGCTSLAVNPLIKVDGNKEKFLHHYQMMPYNLCGFFPLENSRIILQQTAQQLQYCCMQLSQDVNNGFVTEKGHKSYFALLSV